MTTPATELRILVIDDDAMMVKTLADILRLKGYTVETATSGEQALELLKRVRCDCVLSDIKMPGLSGVELYGAIRAQYPNLPVLLMTAHALDHLVQSGLEQGVIGVLNKPLNLETLLAFLNTLRHHLDLPRSVIIIDDDPDFCRTLADALMFHHFVVKIVTDAQAVPAALHSSTANSVILLDMKLNSHDGLTVLQQLKPLAPNLPVVLMTGYQQQMHDAIESALALGAYTCLYKPLDIQALVELLQHLYQRQLAHTLEALTRA